jgi:DNA-binding NarL/FixJ family response regulator
MIRVVFAEDHHLVRQGFRAVIEQARLTRENFRYQRSRRAPQIKTACALGSDQTVLFL